MSLTFAKNALITAGATLLVVYALNQFPPSRAIVQKALAG